MTLENTLTSPSWIYVSWEGGVCTGNVDAASAKGSIHDVTQSSASAAHWLLVCERGGGGLLEGTSDGKKDWQRDRKKEKQ